MKNYPCYIHINASEGYVFATGMEFHIFVNALSKKPNGILLLEGWPEHADFDLRTCFEYISRENMPAFLKENVYNYGDFCWADFQSENAMKSLTDAEISELLFAAHLKRPIASPYFESLENEYLYLCHDDDYWVKVYMKNVDKYKTVIEQKIKSVFMGRKKSMEPIPQEILDQLYQYFLGGAVFDFENCVASSIYTGVRIYPTGDIGFNVDDIHRALDHRRNIAGIGCYLEYNSKRKKWALI